MNATSPIRWIVGLALLLFVSTGCGTGYYESRIDQTVQRVRAGKPVHGPTVINPETGEEEPADDEGAADEPADDEPAAEPNDEAQAANAAATPDAVRRRAARGAAAGASGGVVGRTVLAPLD